MGSCGKGYRRPLAGKTILGRRSWYVNAFEDLSLPSITLSHTSICSTRPSPPSWSCCRRSTSQRKTFTKTKKKTQFLTNTEAASIWKRHLRHCFSPRQRNTSSTTGETSQLFTRDQLLSSFDIIFVRIRRPSYWSIILRLDPLERESAVHL